MSHKITFTPMNIQEKFGKRVKELRTKKNISQEALALLSGIDRTYMTSVENGKRNISIQNIEKIVKGLGITMADFFSEVK
jgi:transcriptional regulator with XRE-family HTH domain